MGKMVDLRLIFVDLPLLISCLHITLLIVIFATIIGLLLGIVLALVRVYKTPVFSHLATIYISFNRGTPMIVQLFIVYFGLPSVLLSIGININRWDKLYFVIITYGLNAAAFMSEIIRASITSVDIGQTEASYSVGMTRLQTFSRIVAPQAFLTALPNLGTSFLGLLQDTSLAFTIGIIDVMGKAQAIGATTYHSIEAYIGAAIIFLVLGTLLEKLFTILEKKVKYKIVA
ncbi:amino acid ABC transporter permease [Clostridium estertheticum]|uniref:Amino acid ABC transporter permease n=1 Tax=Clostridium estertheticum TaxID=238834 RepID=A0AA47I923_9CLOT|nr:amino acid ABC transporter permease [Clostridium estertheticum]MBU3154532.1 amino acid ABC transporter permease [Clostridium estertheticum]MBU3201254.1 amino acid ABC transporter permease [Clostridium estertheticum]WAG62034.1 amino acid ABC transporter permease [Clostridium estertheticum]WAG63842.1 amino acid ABC transporter permease [Clostridium estertheticum]